MNTVDIFVEILVVLLSLGVISAMKHVFYVDVRHLPYQTFIHILCYLMLYNILVFKEISNTYKNVIFYTKTRIKCVEYDFKIQIFIISNHEQTFCNSPKLLKWIADIWIFSQKCLNL